MTIIAFTLFGWLNWSCGNKVASNQRVLGMPGASISVLLANRLRTQS
jgi:hypothetical protein